MSDLRGSLLRDPLLEDDYNNERYQWKLAKLSPNQFYEFVTTGIYHLEGLVTPDVRVGKTEK